jgi:hypothetical protein
VLGLLSALALLLDVLVELDLRSDNDWECCDVYWHLARICRNESAAHCGGVSLNVGKRIMRLCGRESGVIIEGGFDGMMGGGVCVCLSGCEVLVVVEQCVCGS